MAKNIACCEVVHCTICYCCCCCCCCWRVEEIKVTTPSFTCTADISRKSEVHSSLF